MFRLTSGLEEYGVMLAKGFSSYLICSTIGKVFFEGISALSGHSISVGRSTLENDS